MISSRKKGRKPQRRTKAKKGRKMITQEQEKTAKKVLDCAFEVHSSLGPGEVHLAKTFPCPRV
jgi:hypothetical protein